MIYCLIGPSASGKDTVYRRLRALRPEWKPVVLYTTRPVREGETEGVEYHFVTDEVLDQYAQEGRVIEERVYHTVMGPWRYATVDDGFVRTDGADTDYLLIGTLESFRSLRSYFGAEHVMPLYIEVPEELRLERARAREMREEHPRLDEMERRFRADQADFSPEKLRAAGIRKGYRNLDLETCINEILADTGKPNI